MFHRHVFRGLNAQMDCGAMALARVARHHGISIGLQQMLDLVGTNEVGTNLLVLMAAAKALGLYSRGVKGPYEALDNIPLPAIAHLSTEDGLGHFVVLHRWDSNAVAVSDRRECIRNLSQDEFCKRWTGYILVVVADETAL